MSERVDEPIKNESLLAPELLKSNRVVLFGVNGVDNLVENVQNILEEMTNTDLDIVIEYDAGFIKEAFYGTSGYLPAKGINLYQETDEKNPTNSIPAGVIVFPEMHWMPPIGTHGMFLWAYLTKDQHGKTIFENIEELCYKHNVPVVKMEELLIPETIKENLSKFSLFSQSNLLQND